MAGLLIEQINERLDPSYRQRKALDVRRLIEPDTAIQRAGERIATETAEQAFGPQQIGMFHAGAETVGQMLPVMAAAAVTPPGALGAAALISGGAAYREAKEFGQMNEEDARKYANWSALIPKPFRLGGYGVEYPKALRAIWLFESSRALCLSPLKKPGRNISRQRLRTL
jgi:hypothetical protein